VLWDASHTTEEVVGVFVRFRARFGSDAKKSLQNTHKKNKSFHFWFYHIISVLIDSRNANHQTSFDALNASVVTYSSNRF
jgi:hypothetical protein